MARLALPCLRVPPGFSALALLLIVGATRPAIAGDPEVDVAPTPPTEGPPPTPAGEAEVVPFRVEPDSGASVGGDDLGDDAEQESAPEESSDGQQVHAEDTTKAEEKRRRQERIVAFARQRVREMAARKRAQARAEARAQAAAQAKAASDAKAAIQAPQSVRPKVELPAIVDHRSALERQLVAHWGWGADKDRQVSVPLPDWQNWQRVRLFGIEHVTAFRYTKQHHTLTAVFAVETRAEKPSSLSCMAEFERRGFPELRRYGVNITPIEESMSRWDERPVLVHETEGKVSFLFSRYEFSAAWTAYPAYDYGCLVYATVVLWDGQPELARRLLDRFVTEGVARVRPLTAALPTRQPDVPPPAMGTAGRALETAQRR